MEQGSGELLYGFANPHFVTSVGNVAKLPKVLFQVKVKITLIPVWIILCLRGVEKRLYLSYGK